MALQSQAGHANVLPQARAVPRAQTSVLHCYSHQTKAKPVLIWPVTHKCCFFPFTAKYFISLADSSAKIPEISLNFQQELRSPPQPQSISLFYFLFKHLHFYVCLTQKQRVTCRHRVLSKFPVLCMIEADIKARGALDTGWGQVQSRNTAGRIEGSSGANF